LSIKLKELEKKRYRHAENLEFEEAASLRDEILSVKRGVFGEAILTKTKGASPSTE
jgi:excinuclease UvrABC nuclease subunit